MRITVRNTHRATLALRLLEALEPREMFAGYELASLTSMTSGKGGSGRAPQGLIMAPNGDMYGTTVGGGANGYGTVFKVTGTDHAVITLATFNYTNGVSPRGGLVLDSAGNLYGTAIGGGTKGKGVVWQLGADTLAATANVSTTASVLTVLANFAGTNGSYPISGLTIDSADRLYGYTLGVKGSTRDRAVVFSLQPAGTNSTLTTVATFERQTQPAGGLTVDGGGNIYGVTRNGGSSKNGSVFRIAASSSSIDTLVSFAGRTNGSAPNGTLAIDGSGDIFGTTSQGGANGVGTLFKISGTTPTLTTLAHFGSAKGVRPIGNLVLDSGKIYGVTTQGGAKGGGVLFEWAPSGTTSTLTALFSFRGGTSNGANPTGPLVMNASGNFFGATFYGGAGNRGTIFELAPTLIET